MLRTAVRYKYWGIDGYRLKVLNGKIAEENIKDELAKNGVNTYVLMINRIDYIDI